ncbi:MAG: hypothetical protein IIU28_00580 [Lachnospiraceae bacterium]|nr:hypothetical protein [Lachnospiraceae bacterium]
MQHIPSKMPNAQRAKQFLPFAAVRGLDIALQKAEESLTMIERPDLSEETREQINATLSLLYEEYRTVRERLAKLRHSEGIHDDPGDLTFPLVTVTYFDRGFCRRLTGVLSGLDPNRRVLSVVKTEIAFSDLLSIRKGNDPF